MNDEPIDLALLDPRRDPARWQLRIDRIVTEAIRVRQRRISLSGQVERFARPALAIAATLALISWASAVKFNRKPTTSTFDNPTLTLLKWAANDAVPATSEVFQSLGVQNVEP